MFSRKLCLPGSALLLMLALLLSGTQAIAKEFDWVSLISAHTQGATGRDSAIRIVFTRDIAAKDQIGQAADNVLQITPAVSGKASFTSAREIVLTPDSPLTSGERYQVSVQLGQLQDVPADAEVFGFNFQVIPLEFDVRTHALVASADKKNTMSLSGELLASDRLSPDIVKKLLNAKLQGRTLPLTWSFGDNGRKHRFTIDGIPRESVATNLALSWNGKSMGIAGKGGQEIAVPAMDNRCIE